MGHQVKVRGWNRVSQAQSWTFKYQCDQFVASVSVFLVRLPFLSA